MQNFIPKINLRNQCIWLGFLIRIYHDARSPEHKINESISTTVLLSCCAPHLNQYVHVTFCTHAHELLLTSRTSGVIVPAVYQIRTNQSEIRLRSDTGWQGWLHQTKEGNFEWKYIHEIKPILHNIKINPLPSVPTVTLCPLQHTLRSLWITDSEGDSNNFGTYNCATDFISVPLLYPV